MADLMYFDCHATVGQRPMKHPRVRWTTEQLLEDMDLSEISGALVVHGLAKSYDSMYGNARLGTELNKSPDRLFGVWCITPLGEPGFFRSGDELVQALEEADVRAVRLVSGGFSLHPEVMGPTFEVLQAHGILTLLEVGWGTPDIFTVFHNVLSRYPRLPVLLTDPSWPQQRHVYRLMQLHENLHIEFSSYQINRGIETYVADFGDERLLFGTGGTEKSPGAARLYIDYAQISDVSKAKVAGGNLKRLLRGQGPDRASARKRADDPILADAREGRPLSVPVLDAHSHVLHEGGQTAGVNYIMLDGDAEKMLELNAWCGIDRTAMMSWNAPVCTDAEDGNEIVWRAMQRFPGQIHGVAVIDPTHMSPEEMEAEVQLRYMEQGFVGMKPYVRMNLNYEDDRFTPWWEFGNTHKLYALMHVAGHTGGVAGVGRLAERFPEVSWLIAHSGGSYPFAEEVAACICAHPNVYAEITLTPVTNHVVEFLVEATDENHVRFGTDAPMRDPRQQLGWVVWADLSVDVRKKILAENFQRILDRVALPGR
ncbi:MAG: amidohydrolase family protein [bacterium]|nr:amidohydrolase family protein [bacterium]